MLRLFKYSAMAWLAVLFAGCASWSELATGPREGVSGSLVEFMYPDGQQPPEYTGVVPTLQIPLRVGLAFVPSNRGSSVGLPEATKAQLLESVRTRFSEQDYIQQIQIIPDSYLRTRGGFDALDQVSRMFSLDVIALVSYDQLAIADDRTRSFLYWTIVGAYVVKGSENDVRTFVDTAIFDVKTRQLLLRAPGINELTSTSTLVGLPEEMRKARENSFTLAMEEMEVNLEAELELFKERIKEDKSVLIAKRGERKGGSSMGLEPLLVLGAWTALVWLRRRKYPA